MNLEPNRALRIAFVCGSLEPGCDGVGDYVRGLAFRLQKLGHACLCIAINDRPACQADPIKPVLLISSGLLILRLSASTTWDERFTELSKQLADFKPDWVSLQFVPYAFNGKGLPIQLCKGLAKMQPGANWHIMIHELWVDPGAKLRNILLARAQKAIICSLIQSLAPKILHTSNPYYQFLLRQSGFTARILPLFSNIHIPTGASREAKQGNTWTFTFFGSIHREWTPIPLLIAIDSICRSLHLSQCLFVSIGKAGVYGEKLWADLRRQGYPLFQFQILGKLPEDQISSALQNTDFGVTTTPSHLLGKSGSVAAMIAHGLPVIVPRISSKSKPWDGELKASGQFVFLDSNFELSLAKARKYPPHDQLPPTTQQFIEDLRRAT